MGASDATAETAAPAEAEGSQDASKAGVVALPDLQLDALAVEILTAPYYELVALARELGLETTGEADELRARLYSHYGIAAAPSSSAKKKGRTITIERAGKASYVKVEEGEGGIIKASGRVIITLVEENGDSHRIQADSIVFDRTHSSVTARGAVRYERKSGTTTEYFSGEALSVDLDDWSGVFIDGKVRRIGQTSSSDSRGLVISADTILRRSADVMVLKDGVISSCDADDPHYAVKAGRMWILGDKEWAVSDAVFSVGNIPILWLPFFYYPGQEIVFHPVLGYRSREGRFLQTTVYLIGAKPAKSSTTTLFTFNNAETEDSRPTELRGLFLQHVAGPAPKDEGTLKTMADVYSGLGAFTGIQGSFAKLGGLGKTEFFAGRGPEPLAVLLQRLRHLLALFLRRRLGERLEQVRFPRQLPAPALRPSTSRPPSRRAASRPASRSLSTPIPTSTRISATAPRTWIGSRSSAARRMTTIRPSRCGRRYSRNSRPPGPGSPRPSRPGSPR